MYANLISHHLEQGPVVQEFRLPEQMSGGVSSDEICIVVVGQHHRDGTIRTNLIQASGRCALGEYVSGAVGCKLIPGRSPVGDVESGSRSGRFGSRYGGNRTIGRNLAQAIVVQYVKIAVGIHGQAAGWNDLRVDGRAAVPEVAGVAVACDGCDVAVRRDSANSISAEVRNVEIAAAVHGQTVSLHRGTRSRSTIAGVAPVAVARHSRDRSIGRDPANMAPVVGDIQIAGGVHRQLAGPVQRRTASGSSVP